MLALAKTVEDHDVDALHALNCLVGQLMAVAYVSNAMRALREKVPATRKAVLDFKPFNHHAADRKRSRVGKLYHRAVKTVLAPLRADVWEYPVHLLDRLAHRVTDERPADDSVRKPPVERIAWFARNLLAVYRVETADVVERRDMVHVRMGERNGIDFGYAVLETREPKLWRRVDEKRGAVRCRDVGTAASAAVTRIGRRAHAARAADLRNANRSPRP